MNRDERRKLRKVVQSFDRSVRQAHYSFARDIDIMKWNEECKRNNLPLSLECSPRADELDETAKMLGAILKKAEKIDDLLDDILFDSNVDSDFVPFNKEVPVTLGKKDARFLMLLPSSLLERLKTEARRTGLSMNEIACRALFKELAD